MYEVQDALRVANRAVEETGVEALVEKVEDIQKIMPTTSL